MTGAKRQAERLAKKAAALLDFYRYCPPDKMSRQRRRWLNRKAI